VTTTPAATLRYVRWKALVFGALAAGFAGLAVWVAIEALDPAWTAQVTKGQALVDAPVWVRVPVMLAVAAVMLMPGVWQLWAALTGATVVTVGDSGIAARTSFGRRRYLAWSEIVGAKAKKNQIVLSPAGIDTIWQEIWDRKSVLLDTGMLDAAPGEVEALIARYRPELVIHPSR